MALEALEPQGLENVDVEAQQSRNCRKAWDYSLRPICSQGPSPSWPASPHIRPRHPSTLTPKLIVIDTQSLFDWLVFRNGTCAGWDAALKGGAWQWIFTSTMRDEFDHVAAKGFGERWQVPVDSMAVAWTALARLVDIPAALGAGARLHCSDPDDQKFIDLAICAGAHTLVSRDKALLKLARKAREHHGLLVRTPQAWSAEIAANPPA